MKFGYGAKRYEASVVQKEGFEVQWNENAR